jgi:mRNA interferase MazF
MAVPELRRGDCVRLRSPRGARGREQRGERFGVVLQGDEFARLSTLIVAPTSASAREATFRPRVEIDGASTRVLVEHMGAVDPARLGPLVDRLDGFELAAVDLAVRMILDV